MKLIRRVPIYAVGVGLGVALVAVADARNWSGELTLLAALGVGVFYVVMILVPWLIREQVERPIKRRPKLATSVHRANGGTFVSGTDRTLEEGMEGIILGVDPSAHGAFVVLSPEPRWSLVPTTKGDDELIVAPPEQGVVTG